MIKNLVICLFLSLTSVVNAQQPWVYVEVSTDMLRAIKNKEDVSHYKAILAEAKMEQIISQISTDDLRYTFWINVYNAYIQDILGREPKRYDDRRTFFAEPLVRVGGHTFSFGDIEHGILRRSQHPFMMGYVTRPFPSDLELKLRVKKRDYRIHFALNCGAKSCPPVAVYDIYHIQEQLDQSSKNFLTQSTSYDRPNETAKVTSLFSWFLGDFGGRRGIVNIMNRYGISDGYDPDYRMKITNYDWTLSLGDFVEL
jgi:hypothetical protein